MTAIKWLLRAGALGATVAGLGVVLQPSPATAGTCTTPGCGGKVINQVNKDIWVTNCWHDQLSDWYEGSTPPCVRSYSQNMYKAAWYVPYRGNSTSMGVFYYDVDAFQAPAGCITTGYISGPRSFFFDRRGKSALWKRVYFTDTAYITGLSC